MKYMTKFAESVKFQSRCQKNEEGEKPNNFFLNLNKVRGSQGKFCKIIVSNNEITYPQIIKY